MTDLSKWPRLLVVGQPVDRTQANEILVRTNQWHLATNDREWQASVYQLAGLAVDHLGYPTARALASFEAEVGVLELHYLHNHQIASAWIGGPYGWCDWDGAIGCTTWNIGKWPSQGEVEDDLRQIAAAFPYLDLGVQLVPDEGQAPTPAVTYWLHGGTVDGDHSLRRFLASPTQLPDAHVLGRMLGGRARERGVDIGRLAEALKQVREARRTA
jgi:hypothetical protein